MSRIEPVPDAWESLVSETLSTVPHVLSQKHGSLFLKFSCESFIKSRSGNSLSLYTIQVFLHISLIREELSTFEWPVKAIAKCSFLFIPPDKAVDGTSFFGTKLRSVMYRIPSFFASDQEIPFNWNFIHDK